MANGTYVGLLTRLTDLLCDALVVGLLLIAVHTGALSPAAGTAAIGFAIRSLVQPSLALGVFTPSNQSAVTQAAQKENGNG